MTNFINDGTSLPAAKVDLVPLGASPPTLYVAASDWNASRQALLDIQTFLRGNLQVFKTTDTAVRADVLVSSGAPTMTALKGSLALDVTTPSLYQNQDGASSWAALGGGGGGSIGGVVAGGTAGSVLFIDTGGVLAQDNANFYWHNTTKRLGLGTTAPSASIDARASLSGGYMASLRNTNVAGYSAVEYVNNSGTPQGIIGYGNSGVGLTHLQSKLFILSSTADVVIANAASAALTFHPVAGSAGMTYAAGSGLAVGAASTGRVRYNEGTSKLQVSLNGGAYVDFITSATTFTLDIGDAIGGSTAGSVLFVGASTDLQQNNTFFTWNNTARYLAVHTDSATDGSLFLRSTVATGPAAAGFINSAGTFKSYVGYFNASYAFTHFANKNGFFATTGEDIVLGNSTVAQATFGMTATQAFMQMANGGSSALSAANTGRLIYNTTGQKFQISANGGAYADIVVGSGMSIGGAIASSTVGSVLFVGAGGVLQQDNTNFFWDDTNNALTVTTTTSASAIRAVNADSVAGAMSIRNTNAAGPVDFYAIDSVGNAKMSWGYGNASYSDTARASRAYLWRNTGVDMVFARTGIIDAALTSTGALIVGASAALTKTGFSHEFFKDAANVVTASAYGTGLNAEFMAFRGRGTGAATTAVLSGDVLGAFSYAGATTATAIKSGAFSRALATENWSATANGTKIETYTIPNTTNAAVLRTTLDQDGVFRVEGSGLISIASSFSAGFYNTALFASSPSGLFNQADRELRIQAGANAGGQKQQYLTFNGRWSGNIDSPTLTQGLYDRVCGIEFNTAADSLGPNPNSSLNFFVNTGTKGTGAEFVVTPTRAMTITYTARVGIGQVNPSQPFDVETVLGNTNAKFGSSLPVYVVSNNPNIGFNAYYNGGWKFGKGSAGHYACTMGFDPVTPVWSLGITTSNGSADGAATPVTQLSVSATGVITAPGLASTTIDAIVLAQATTGALRVQVPTSPGFGYDFTNHRLTINTHPVIMFASVDVTNPTQNMISLRNTQAYSATSGSLIYLAGDLVPSAADQRVGGLTLGGWSGGGAFYQPGALFEAFSEAGWTAGSSHPTYVTIKTAPSGSATPVERMRFPSDGSFQMPNSAAAVSAASTGRLRYTTTGQKFQVSLNGAAYVDVATSDLYVPQTRTLTAGSGLTGTGDLSANRTFDVGAGNGITVNADDVAVNLGYQFNWTARHTWKAHAAFSGSEAQKTTAAVQTTDATQTTLFTLAVPDTTDVQIEARVVARDTAGTERALYGKVALVYREGGGATIQGSVQDVFADVETSAGIDATFTVSGNNVLLSVTGLAATTINWAATITYQMVSGAA